MPACWRRLKWNEGGDLVGESIFLCGQTDAFGTLMKFQGIGKYQVRSLLLFGCNMDVFAIIAMRLHCIIQECHVLDWEDQDVLELKHHHILAQNLIESFFITISHISSSVCRPTLKQNTLHYTTNTHHNYTNKQCNHSIQQSSDFPQCRS